MGDADVLHSMNIDDSYTVLRVLGDSSYGKTELVELNGVGPFVRKRIPLSIANPDAWATAMHAHHFLLPKVHVMYETPDEFCVISDYIEGRSLKEVVEEIGSIPAQPAIRIALDICDAASALHTVGIIHRDISPSNIILNNGHAYLIDLGIARKYSYGDSSDTTHLGTYGFAAPEQFGFAQTDNRSDVFSIGRILGFALSGHTPENAHYDSALSAMASEGIVAAIRKACEFEPSRRWQSVGEFAEALKVLQQTKSQVVYIPESANGEPAPTNQNGTRQKQREAIESAQQVIENRYHQLHGHESAGYPTKADRQAGIQELMDSGRYPVSDGFHPASLFREIVLGTAAQAYNVSHFFSGGRKLVAALYILGTIFCVSLLLRLPMSMKPVPNDGWAAVNLIAAYLMSFFLFYVPVEEFCCKMLRVGPYSSTNHQGSSTQSFFRRYLKYVLLMLLIEIILFSVASLFLGPYPSSS